MTELGDERTRRAVANKASQGHRRLKMTTGRRSLQLRGRRRQKKRSATEVRQATSLMIDVCSMNASFSFCVAAPLSSRRILFPSKIIRQSPGICATRASPGYSAYRPPRRFAIRLRLCASFRTTKYAQFQTVIPVLNRNTTPRAPP